MSLPLKALLSLVAAASLLVSPGYALIVARYDGPGSPGLINTEPPADDPGWANLASNRSGIYLGDGWFMSARHAGAAGGIRMGGGIFPLIPGTDTRLANPSSFGGSIDDESDVFIWRVGVDQETGLTPEELVPEIRTIQIADSIPGTSEELTIFGRGRQRFLNSGNPETGEFYFTSSGANTTEANAAFSGFRQPGPNPETNQWGTNTRTTSRPNGIRSVGSNIMIPETGSVMETIGYLTQFDENGLLNEATAAPGDSGGPVFFKDSNDDWVLSGLMHVVFFPNGADFPSTGPFGAYGSYTGISDLSNSTYFDQLEDIRSRPEYSIVGDLDLDGVVEGSIINGQATGDLRLLVDNWLTSTSGDDIHSWMSGDLNFDGTVNLEDFVLLREALGGSVSIEGFAALVGVAAVPEPTTVALLLMGAAAAAARRVR